MSVLEVIIVSIGLSLDAFTVTVCTGATQPYLKKRMDFIVGLAFGGIQAIMLTIGMMITKFPVSSIYSETFKSINQWFSAIIFIFLGLKMIKNALTIKSINEQRESFNYRNIFSLAFATSLDALVLGIGFALLRTEIIIDMFIIFVITGISSIIGLRVGYRVGDKYRVAVNICGSVILLIMGVKMILSYFKII
ncbi:MULTISPECIES: manganese efflux pump MntP family protein [unclassified Clostridium]|uniref:manganese efflux pump MntP n=1 Tax=unclassified Clostridium TaxID=2614128 RepID=UPI0032171362